VIYGHILRNNSRRVSKLVPRTIRIVLHCAAMLSIAELMLILVDAVWICTVDTCIGVCRYGYIHGYPGKICGLWILIRM